MKDVARLLERCCDATIDSFVTAIKEYESAKIGLKHALEVSDGLESDAAQKAFKRLMDVESNIRVGVKKIVVGGLKWDMR